MRTLPVAVTTPVLLSACCRSDSIVTSPVVGVMALGVAVVVPVALVVAVVLVMVFGPAAELGLLAGEL